MYLSPNRCLSRVLLWDWEANVTKGKVVYSNAMTSARNYLNAHPPVTDEMLLREAIQEYNGGRYYRWDSNANTWVVSSADGGLYVNKVLDAMVKTPWQTLIEVEQFAGKAEQIGA
jgi:hypothetical protein